MGKYKIALSDRAKEHLKEWKKSGQLIALRKIEKIFIDNLAAEPTVKFSDDEFIEYLNKQTK